MGLLALLNSGLDLWAERVLDTEDTDKSESLIEALGRDLLVVRGGLEAAVVYDLPCGLCLGDGGRRPLEVLERDVLISQGDRSEGVLGHVAKRLVLN